jgi:hypothetical protein
LAAKNAIDRAPHGSILVFGDNIVEGAPPLPTICGHAVVNGGVSGATIGYFERHGRTTRIYHPRLICSPSESTIHAPCGPVSIALRRDRHAAFARVAVAVAMVTRVRSGTGAAGYLADRVPTFGTAIRATPETASVIDLNEPL